VASLIGGWYPVSRTGILSAGCRECVGLLHLDESHPSHPPGAGIVDTKIVASVSGSDKYLDGDSDRYSYLDADRHGSAADAYGHEANANTEASDTDTHASPNATTNSDSATDADPASNTDPASHPNAHSSQDEDTDSNEDLGAGRVDPYRQSICDQQGWV